MGYVFLLFTPLCYPDGAGPEIRSPSHKGANGQSFQELSVCRRGREGDILNQAFEYRSGVFLQDSLQQTICLVNRSDLHFLLHGMGTTNGGADRNHFPNVGAALL